uniref:Uncharacterized protein n=1 Tax=Aegilops tauschii subsp. strangulata TaxID=200361 RepID=A0A453KZA5_AEGTS
MGDHHNLLVLSVWGTVILLTGAEYFVFTTNDSFHHTVSISGTVQERMPFFKHCINLSFLSSYCTRSYSSITDV